MPITLKHSGNEAVNLIGAYAGGEGQRGADDAKTMSQQTLQRYLAERQSAGQMMSQLKQSQDASQQAAINRAHKMMDDRQARLDAIENRDLQRQWALDDRAAQWEHENAVYDRNQQGMRDQIEWRVTAEQKAKFDQLEKGYQDAVASGEYDEGELAEIKRQVRSQQYGLSLPRPKLRETPTDMADEFAKSTYTDPTGNLWGRRQNGDWNLLKEAPPATPEPEDAQTVFDRNVVQHGGRSYYVDPKTGRPTPLEAEAGTAYAAPQLSWQDYSKLYSDLAKTQVPETDDSGRPRFDIDPDTGVQTPRMRNRTPEEIQDEIDQRWSAWTGSYAPRPPAPAPQPPVGTSPSYSGADIGGGNRLPSAVDALVATGTTPEIAQRYLESMVARPTPPDEDYLRTKFGFGDSQVEEVKHLWSLSHPSAEAPSPSPEIGSWTVPSEDAAPKTLATHFQKTEPPLELAPESPTGGSGAQPPLPTASQPPSQPRPQPQPSPRPRRPGALPEGAIRREGVAMPDGITYRYSMNGADIGNDKTGRKFAVINGKAYPVFEY